jgi:hypothetical protein
MLPKAFRRIRRIMRSKNPKKVSPDFTIGEIEHWSQHMKKDIGFAGIELPVDRSIHPDARALIESIRR